MTAEELREEIAIELENIETVLRELSILHEDAKGREVSVREKTAASAFLAQFYNGIENILKRISRYSNVPLPSGEIWHVELFRRFCAPSFPSLPVLFDESLSSGLAPYRKFRHVVHHGYGFQLDWERMAEGIEHVDGIHQRLKKGSKIIWSLFDLISQLSGIDTNIILDVLRRVGGATCYSPGIQANYA